MKYHFKIHKEKKGYWAECLELKGCYTQAGSLKVLKANMAEALNLYLDEPEDSKVVFPLPDKKLSGRNIVEISGDKRIVLASYIRRLRILHGWTQQEVAKRLGMPNIYSYQRLERRPNPRLNTLAMLKQVFPEFSMDLVLGA